MFRHPDSFQESLRRRSTLLGAAPLRSARLAALAVSSGIPASAAAVLAILAMPPAGAGFLKACHGLADLLVALDSQRTGTSLTGCRRVLATALALRSCRSRIIAGRTLQPMRWHWPSPGSGAVCDHRDGIDGLYNYPPEGVFLGCELVGRVLRASRCNRHVAPFRAGALAPRPGAEAWHRENRQGERGTARPAGSGPNRPLVTA